MAGGRKRSAAADRRALDGPEAAVLGALTAVAGEMVVAEDAGGGGEEAQTPPQELRRADASVAAPELPPQTEAARDGVPATGTVPWSQAALAPFAAGAYALSVAAAAWAALELVGEERLPLEAAPRT